MNNLVVGSLVFMLVTLGWSNRSLGEQVSTPRGELRIVDNSSFNFVTVVFNIFEHLLDIEEGGKLVPRLATGWRWVDDRTLEMTLRQGVKFHNGEPFDAAVVQLNWDENTRVRQPFRAGQFLTFKPGSRLEILEPYTVRFYFSIYGKRVGCGARCACARRLTTPSTVRTSFAMRPGAIG